MFSILEKSKEENAKRQKICSSSSSLEVDQTVKNLTTLMEPFIIVILGIGVGFLIISIITPIYSLISSIK